MEEFTVFVKNKPGQLARICDALYRNGVNIEAMATEGTREDGTVKVITNDSITTRRALNQARMPFETNEVLLVKILNRPGELAKVTSKIGDAGVNLESVYLIGDERFAVRVNDIDKARRILKDDILN